MRICLDSDSQRLTERNYFLSCLSGEYGADVSVEMIWQSHE